MKEIIINSPKYGEHKVFIDDEDFELINKYTWRLLKQPRSYTLYAITNIFKNEKYCTTRIHRLIMNCLDNKLIHIDHINHNGLDNRKENLRLVTPSQNQMNRNKRQFSEYKGVAFNKSRNNYCVFINKKGKEKYLGTFKTQKEAAIVYDKAAIYYFGEYAKLNFNISNYSNIKHNSKSIICKRKQTSKYKGVSIHHTNKWRSYIVINKKQIWLGLFDTEIDAAKEYNDFIIKNNLNRKLNIIKENI